MKTYVQLKNMKKEFSAKAIYILMLLICILRICLAFLLNSDSMKKIKMFSLKIFMS